MRTNYCHRFVACNLKILNFFQFFVGISTLIFSGILLNRWQNRIPLIPSPPPQAPARVVAPNCIQSINSDVGSLEVADQINTLNLARELFVRSDLNLRIQLYSVELPAPCSEGGIRSHWGVNFVTLALIVGIRVPEVIDDDCEIREFKGIVSLLPIGSWHYIMQHYLLLTIVILLLEAALVPFFTIDHEWEKDLPYDPTGELERFRCFVQDNADICRWVGITLITVQAFSLLLSLVLRALISTRGKQPNIENGYATSGQPLLNPQQNRSSGLIKGASTRTGMWMTQLRQKLLWSRFGVTEQGKLKEEQVTKIFIV
ncbi:hypothetical protein Cgig2_020798 [Carnegiea gigantea]|uniref:Uncharacterized protein n=1 Tax=Carnegiea gigantea TaxID=171969 RepID=A0A9Q1QIY6_9CARY|nr:hypothetical protein Cgig2_020798 [Carnegiea gigantea]